MTAATEPRTAPRGGDTVHRHRLSVRLWHWLNAGTFLVMFMSGLMIFNAHPRLYWGEYGANPDPAWLEIGASDGQGLTRVGALTIETTGLLGLSEHRGTMRERAFPDWATLPSYYSLAVARRWHLTFAWLFAGGIAFYLLWTLLNGHLRRDLWPRRAEITPRAIWSDIVAHARLRLPRGAEAARYHILQKLAYLSVTLLAIPGMVLTGLAMSPAMTAAWPWLLDLFGGRQSARSLHFIIAWGLVGFIVVHLVMVLLAGPLNGIRAMITGRFRLPKERHP